jgi:mycothiol synthase
MTNAQISFADSIPKISNLSFRTFLGPDDFPDLATIANASNAADQVERVITAEELAHAYLTDGEPYHDIILAEINGELIGYSRGFWFIEGENRSYVYGISGYLIPTWRRQGKGRVLLLWVENRLRKIALAHPADLPKYFQAHVTQHKVGLAAMLEKEGYQAVRYFDEMLRPNLDNLPQFPLPDGLEVRLVPSKYYRLIWEANHEAMQDHWGVIAKTEADYQAWLNDPALFQPHLWQVAWDILTDQIAGQVLTEIDHLQNEKFARKRGYTENISVRRPWRRQGLARALIARSLAIQREHGMTESALSVDSENLSGATRVFEECGFRMAKRATTYRKPF